MINPSNYHLEAALRTLNRAVRHGEDVIDKFQAEALLNVVEALKFYGKKTNWADENQDRVAMMDLVEPWSVAHKALKTAGEVV